MATSGPRRLVFKTIKDASTPVQDVPLGTAYTADTPLDSQNLRIHSASQPQLLEGSQYTISIRQTVSTGATPSAVTKDFTAQGSKWSLDPALINTVYPQQGHSDYATVLPHVVFNNSQVPWVVAGDADSNLPSPPPWLGLLVFTEDELLLSSADLATIQTKSGVTALSPSSTFAYPMTAQQLVNLSGTVSPSYNFDPSGMNKASPVQPIFLKDALAHKLFQPYNTYPNNTPAANPSKPDLGRFNFMSHVRRFNTVGLANSDGLSNATLAVTVSPRSGPLNIVKPTIVYAHLVCLSNFSNLYRINSPGTSGLTALISLYSWSYTCLSPDLTSLTETFETLAANIQPLRNPDAGICGTLGSKTQPVRNSNNSNATIDKWVQNRMLSGYSLVRYVMQTGEPTIALQKGFLVPTNPPDLNLPQSHAGSDLAILDPELGYLDITYQVAWQLGKLLALGDRDASAALVRVKSSLHHQTVAKTKNSAAGGVFITAGTAIGALSGAATTIKDKLSSISTQLSAQRWVKPRDATTTTRGFTSFSHDYIQSSYVKKLGSVMPLLASAVEQPHLLRSPPLSNNDVNVNQLAIYNEVNTAANTDYGILLAWVMDKWFLHGLPLTNLIPDPAFIPKESIRTFYVDPNWLKALIDGALSIGEHYTDDDDARASIQDSLSKYLSTNIQSGTYNYPPQVPRWGFFLRSKIVANFSDLRIDAPRAPHDNSTAAEILRMDVIDQDLLLVLFDRVPGQFHPTLGIRITPPEHQLSFKLGIDDGPPGLVGGNLGMHWRKVYSNPQTAQDHNNPLITPAGSYNKNQSTNGVYDFDPATRSLIFPHFAKEAAKVQSTAQTNAIIPTAAVVGSQLIGSTSELTILTNYGAGDLPKPINLTPNKPAPTNVPIPSQTPTDTNLSSITIPKITDTIPTIMKLLASRYVPDAASVALLGYGSLNTAYDQHVQDSQDFPVPAQLQVTVSTVSGPNGYSKTVAYTPVNSGFTSDLHVKLRCKDTSKTGFFANSIQVIFSIGTTASDVLYPFLTLGTVATPPVASIRSNGVIDAPHKPASSGTKVPKVRFVGVGKRWTATGSTDTPGKFIITLVPSYTSSTALTATNTWGDVALSPNLDFVLQDVQLNPPAGQGITNFANLYVVENYRVAGSYAPSTPGGPLVARSYCSVSIMAFDVVGTIKSANP